VPVRIDAAILRISFQCTRISADIDAAGDQRLQGGIGERLGEAVEAAVFQVGDSRRKLEPKQDAQGKKMIRDPAAIGVMPVKTRACLGLIIEEAIENMDGFACRRGDHFGVEGGVAIRDMGVEFGAGFVAVMRV
jgi:hypothetical protein